MTRRLALALAAGWLLLVGALVAAGLVLHLLLPDPAAASASRPAPASSSPSGESAPSVAPLGRTGTPRDSGLVPAAVTGDDRPAGAPAPSAAASPQPAPTVGAPVTGRIVRGVASHYGRAYGAHWLALPEGPGVRVRVTGPGGSVVRTSNDAGPDLAMQRAGRVVDLSWADFRAICGCTVDVGLIRVTVEYLP